MGKKMMKLMVYTMLAVGGFLICDGMWLKVKAMVAQKMLHHAWEETVRTGVSVKPWPWADSWPVARLRVDRLGIDHIVLEGDSGEVLAFGPGHLTNSAVPGTGGNCILAGHRDTSFKFLKDLQPGDLVSLQAINGKKYDFEVSSAHIENRSALYLEQSENSWLTLITCYPFDAIRPGTDQRYVVFASLAQAL